MHRHGPWMNALIACLVLKAALAGAQTLEKTNPFSAYPRDRIIRPVDDAQRTVLSGNRPPMAQPEFRVKPVAANFPMNRILLVLQPDADQQAALDSLVAAQQDPNSPYYHQWITPEEFGQLYGASEGDINLVTNWLELHGMRVEEVVAGRRSIIFSGTAAQVSSAFHTRIQTYQVDGETHYANDSDPEIPQAFAGVVGGLVSLHDFRTQPMHVLAPPSEAPTPSFSSGSSHYLTPGDFAVIYDVNPLYQQLIDGSGQSLAIVGRTNIHLSDVRTFRSNFGLPPRDPQIILNGSDPGIVSSDEEVEAALDVEWSGAVAKNTNVKFVVSASTNSSDGVYLSAQYIVNHNVAPVMSVSFGLCEAALGASGNSFLNSLWQQAAAEGITVLVSSGDSGAAGCDPGSARTATHGKGINGLCSPSYSVCVGGTQFNDTDNPSLYWTSLNSTTSLASALSYIPENVWNESGSSGLWSGGGGVTTIYNKPSWQTGPGVPADGKRDVPDVSLTAAVHDGYLVYMEGGLMLVGGTSAASPSLAGLMSLVVQNAGSAQGNANPVFYRLAARQNAGGVAIFHDTTNGNNSVPGVSGYNAAVGYDLASGLGSVDANLLVSHWGDSSAAVPAFQFSATKNSLSLVAGGDSGTVNLNVSVSGGFSDPVAFSVSGLPAGVTASFSPASLAAPGAGSSMLTLTASAGAKAGSAALTITASSGETSKTTALSLTVTIPATFTLTVPATSYSLAPGSSGALNYKTVISGPFKSMVSMSVSGQPSGLTAGFSPSTIPSPGSGQSKLTLTAGPGTTPGTYVLSITASGGGVTRAASLTVNVPGFTLTVAPATVSIGPGGKSTATLTTAVKGGLSSTMSFSISGVPAGITSGFSPASLVAPGSGSSTLTFTRGSGGKTGTYTLTITASCGGFKKTNALPLAVTAK